MVACVLLGEVPGEEAWQEGLTTLVLVGGSLSPIMDQRGVRGALVCRERCVEAREREVEAMDEHGGGCEKPRALAERVDLPKSAW